VVLAQLPTGVVLPYYNQQPSITNIVAAPVVCDGLMLGALVVDRVVGHPFAHRNICTISHVAAQIGQVLGLHVALQRLKDLATTDGVTGLM
jgi:GAF domain-containing protein